MKADIADLPPGALSKLIQEGCGWAGCGWASPAAF